MMKRAMITGIYGQDGAYLAKLLVEKGYEVYGVSSRRVNQSSSNLDWLGVTGINFVNADMTDQTSLQNVIKSIRPDEFYNLAAMSFVGSSWDTPVYTSNVNAMGVLYVLEAIKNYAPHCKIYQASTSEMFGNCGGSHPKNEETNFVPRSPYGVAKTFAHNMMVNYRESYGMFASNGILFNHESPIRGLEFVTRKITDGVAKISLGLQDTISLGNLDSKRDWGFSGDYVKAMHAMLQADEPDDFVIATGETYTIRDFLDLAFMEVGIEDWSKHVYQDPAFIRPAELDVLLGDPTKAKNVLGWEPEVSIGGLVAMMMEADIERNS
jgi:GDPmannose 4,6-dehydratase